VARHFLLASSLCESKNAMLVLERDYTAACLVHYHVGNDEGANISEVRYVLRTYMN
jgi:hypothetical protein